jgi:hypothetical protein
MMQRYFYKRVHENIRLGGDIMSKAQHANKAFPAHNGKKSNKLGENKTEVVVHPSNTKEVCSNSR